VRDSNAPVFQKASKPVSWDGEAKELTLGFVAALCFEMVQFFRIGQVGGVAGQRISLNVNVDHPCQVIVPAVSLPVSIERTRRIVLSEVFTNAVTRSRHFSLAMDLRTPSVPRFPAEKVGYQSQFRSTPFPRML